MRKGKRKLAAWTRDAERACERNSPRRDGFHFLASGAKENGLLVMVGGMVETRLGMAEGAHLAAALGGVDFVDLDTALLLSEDPFEGGYEAIGPEIRLATEGPHALGFGVSLSGSA